MCKVSIYIDNYLGLLSTYVLLGEHSLPGLQPTRHALLAHIKRIVMYVDLGESGIKGDIPTYRDSPLMQLLFSWGKN